MSKPYFNPKRGLNSKETLQLKHLSYGKSDTALFTHRKFSKHRLQVHLERDERKSLRLRRKKPPVWKCFKKTRLQRKIPFESSFKMFPSLGFSHEFNLLSHKFQRFHRHGQHHGELGSSETFSASSCVRDSCALTSQAQQPIKILFLT